jgi:hypothetical protein
MGNLIKNTVALLLMIIGLIGIIIWLIALITQFLIWFIPLIIHSNFTINLWGLWFLLIFIIGVLVIILIPEADPFKKLK